MTDQLNLTPPIGGEVVLPVSVLSRTIVTVLERAFPLAWIAGEVSNFCCAASGHWYFLIKDATAQIRCVMFRNRAQYAEFIPRDGDRIEVRGRVTVYEPRGELQLNLEQLRRTGQGRLYQAFLQLKQQLADEGLFDPAHKRALPAYPRVLGVITSLQAAALRDVLTTLTRRAPHLPVIVYPAPVQGASAAQALAERVREVGARAEVEVLILCRGGGSIEDLWSFNDEALARAIAACPIPIVTGIGHQTDFTIADFAADLRAPTPTAAAELASPPRIDLLRDLDHWRARLARWFNRAIEQRAQQLDWLSRRLINPVERLAHQRALLRQLAERLMAVSGWAVRDAGARFTLVQLRWRQSRPDAARRRQQLAALAARLSTGFAHCHKQRRAQLAQCGARIRLLSPQRTFERGYAALLEPRTGQAVRAPAALQPGRRVFVYLADGSADIKIADLQVPAGEQV